MENEKIEDLIKVLKLKKRKDVYGNFYYRTTEGKMYGATSLKDLIRKTGLPLSEIMMKVGFNTEQHFFSQFKRFTGVTPKSLRS